MTIREATAADSVHLVELATRFLAESAYARLGSPDPARLAALAERYSTIGWSVPPDAARNDDVTALLQGLIQTCFTMGVVVVAEGKGGDLVGMIAVGSVTHPFTGHTYAEELAWYVEPEYRHGTLGPRLLNYVHEWARLQGLSLVKMGAPADAPAVGAFYERLGYRPFETTYVKELL